MEQKQNNKLYFKKERIMDLVFFTLIFIGSYDIVYLRDVSAGGTLLLIAILIWVFQENIKQKFNINYWFEAK